MAELHKPVYLEVWPNIMGVSYWHVCSIDHHLAVNPLLSYFGNGCHTSFAYFSSLRTHISLLLLNHGSRTTFWANWGMFWKLLPERMWVVLKSTIFEAIFGQQILRIEHEFIKGKSFSQRELQLWFLGGSSDVTDGRTDRHTDTHLLIA